jgi:hypothetical protein
VYDYIEKYWHKNKSILSSGPFDIEECFSFIELQLNEAIESGNFENAKSLREVQFRLKLFLAEVLSEFSHSVMTSDVMRQLGLRLHSERPIIITFNYDTFLEEILEFSAGQNLTRPPFETMNRRHDEMMKNAANGNFRPIELSDEEIGYHNYHWMRSLGYGMECDIVSWDFPGPEEFIEGKKFYSHPSNKPYSWYLLKLHGSLNWFRYLPIRAFPSIYGEAEPSLSKERAEQIILSRQSFWFNQNPVIDGWYIDPLIVTPTIYKEKQLTEGVFRKISVLWDKARDALSGCKTLIVVGYSFPPTDFLTKKLFLESFSENRLNKLIIVNPDTSIVQKVKELCHYEMPVLVCKDLVEYIRAGGSVLDDNSEY